MLRLVPQGEPSNKAKVRVDEAVEAAVKAVPTMCAPNVILGKNANGGTNRKTTDFPVFASVAARKVIVVSIAQRVPKIPRSESLLGTAKEVTAT